MMKTVFSFYLAVISGMMILSGCSKNASEDITPIPDPTPEVVKKIEIKISPSIGETKANEYGFESGDCIGLYVVSYDGATSGTLKDVGNHVDNMRFTYSGSWTPDSKIYWVDETTHADMYLVYPYSSISSVSAMTFSVMTDQSDENSYKSCDLMIGKAQDVAPSEDAINIVANHMLSQVSISLQAGNGFTTETLADSEISVKINGLLTSASVDIAKATVTATGDAATIIPLRQNDVYKALVVPQTVSDTNLITVTADGRDHNLNSTLTFESGRKYDFTVTLSKTSTGINVAISPWINDGEDYGGTAE